MPGIIYKCLKNHVESFRGLKRGEMSKSDDAAKIHSHFPLRKVNGIHSGSSSAACCNLALKNAKAEVSLQFIRHTQRDKICVYAFLDQSKGILPN